MTVLPAIYSNRHFPPILQQKNLPQTSIQSNSPTIPSSTQSLMLAPDAIQFISEGAKELHK